MRLHLLLQVKIDITPLYCIVMNVTMVMKQYPCSGDYIKVAAMTTHQQMTSCTFLVAMETGGNTVCTAECSCDGVTGCQGVYTSIAASQKFNAMLVEVVISRNA